MRIVVAGAAGQLGSTMVARLSRQHTVVGLTRRDLDISDAGAVEQVVSDLSPDAIVNCAAYNDVDGAESDAYTALQTNAMGVRHLARAAGRDAALVHYSTDFVFDGTATVPYREGDRARPLSAYGLTKLLGEWLALEAAAAYVLRVESLFGGEPAKSTMDTILHRLRRGERVHVFHDRVVTPSYVHDVAAATEVILERRPPPGVYHCVNSGSATWLDVARAAAARLSSAAEIVPVSLHDAKLKAARPQYCALSNEKLRGIGIDMPDWQDALGRHIRAGSTEGAGLRSGPA
jgi:dTDP-4-dehydrorhamnose reductase